LTAARPRAAATIDGAQDQRVTEANSMTTQQCPVCGDWIDDDSVEYCPTCGEVVTADDGPPR
jgi:rubrerythrin